MNPIHIDRHYSAQTEFGQPLVNSPFVLALVTGLSVTDVSQHTVNLGWTILVCKRGQGPKRPVRVVR